MTHAETGKLVAMIAVTYPTPSWEPESIALWREMIADLEYAPAAAVVQTWIKTCDERPSIAAIRRGVADRQFVREDGVKLFLPPDEAWEFVFRCFGSVGQYREFPDTHPLVKEAVDRIGWVSMCMSTNQDVLRGQFRHVYVPLLERSMAETAASKGAAAAPAAVAPMLEQQAEKLEHERPRLGASRG